MDFPHEMFVGGRVEGYADSNSDLLIFIIGDGGGWGLKIPNLRPDLIPPYDVFLTLVDGYIEKYEVGDGSKSN